MKCELISVGTEILLGDIVNTNAHYLSNELAALGIDVLFQHTVGDNERRLTDTLELALSESDCVILTGGLGPTEDDITKEVCAKYFGYPLKKDEDILRDIKAYFVKKNIEMPLSNEKQAYIPEPSITLYNENGTAPGSILEKDGKIIIILPGPPKEMIPMFNKSVVPYLSKFTQGIIKSVNVRTFGIGESDMAERVGHLLQNENPTVAPYAKSGEALLRVTAKAKTEEEAEKLLRPVVEEIEGILSDFVYTKDKNSIEEVTVSLLKEKKLTLATAESCTAGLISKRITDISGASEVYMGSVVSYSNDVKMNVLKVREESLKKYGAVSEAVAAEMALGVIRLLKTDLAVSITGIAGPLSDSTEKEVGLIYIAVTDGEKVSVKKLLTGHKKGDSCRDYNRFTGASNALNEVRLFILGKCRELKDINDFINSF